MGRVVVFLFFLLISVLIISCREKITEPQENISSSGSIYLNSDPPGARIYVNGIFRNKFTPDSLVRLNPGIYNITLLGSLDIADTTFEVFLQQGKKVSYNITLRNLSN